MVPGAYLTVGTAVRGIPRNVWREACAVMVLTGGKGPPEGVGGAGRGGEVGTGVAETGTTEGAAIGAALAAGEVDTGVEGAASWAGAGAATGAGAGAVGVVAFTEAGAAGEVGGRAGA